MAVLFQFNPDQCDFRDNIKPGNSNYWKVTRYAHLMGKGILTLLWGTHLNQPGRTDGLFGWGITTTAIERDDQGNLQIKLLYIERWIDPEDEKNNIADQLEKAPIPASTVLGLTYWQDNLISLLPVGTNFLVTPNQLYELEKMVIHKKFPESQFKQAVDVETSGRHLDPNKFTPKRLVGGD